MNGIRADRLRDLDTFIRHTDSNSLQLAGQWTETWGTERMTFWRAERRTGPGRGETTCSWRTLNWMEVILAGWQEGQIFREGVALDLPAYLSLVERAGQRCAGDRFYEILHAGIKNYVDRGLLEDGWFHKPTGDIQYMIQNGPLIGDYPIPEVKNLISFLNKIRDTNATTTAALKTVNEYLNCLNTPKANRNPSLLSIPLPKHHNLHPQRLPRRLFSKMPRSD